MSHARVRWLSGIGDERIVLTTDPNDFAKGERIHELELRSLLWLWLADRNATEELASLYAEMSFAPEPPTAWAPHELEKVLRRFVENACASGWLIALRNPVLGRSSRGLPRQPAPRPPSHPPTDPPPSRPPGPHAPTFFEVRYVDEIGEPIPAAALQFDIAGKHPRVTDGAGHARVDDATADFGSVTATDVPQLREQLRPRWDLIREEAWLEPAPDHTFVALRHGRSLGASLLSETLHTVVVQPWCIRARLIGMYFDTNKCFLLPSAMPHIRSVKRLYDDNPDSALLVVGHTDTTGGPWDNDPLSLERAASVAAYLTDDVEAWLPFYDPGITWWKRWGTKEDHLMIAALSDYSTRPDGEPPLRWFQRTRGLPQTGIANAGTRRELIQQYMSIDDTTLPAGVPITTHGCGENFPIEEQSGREVVDDLDVQYNRRVELYFFDRDLGVQPRPLGRSSQPGSREYPEWVARALRTYDFELLREQPFLIGFFIGRRYPKDDGDLVVVSGAEEVRRYPLLEADHRENGYVYFEIDPDLLPARIAAYWDRGDDASLVLADCSPASISRSLRRDDTPEASDGAFGKEPL